MFNLMLVRPVLLRNLKQIAIEESFGVGNTLHYAVSLAQRGFPTPEAETRSYAISRIADRTHHSRLSRYWALALFVLVSGYVC